MPLVVLSLFALFSKSQTKIPKLLLLVNISAHATSTCDINNSSVHYDIIIYYQAASVCHPFNHMTYGKIKQSPRWAYI
jgi:hypothetical protein